MPKHRSVRLIERLRARRVGVQIVLHEPRAVCNSIPMLIPIATQQRSNCTRSGQLGFTCEILLRCPAWVILILGLVQRFHTLVNIPFKSDIPLLLPDDFDHPLMRRMVGYKNNRLCVERWDTRITVLGGIRLSALRSNSWNK